MHNVMTNEEKSTDEQVATLFEALGNVQRIKILQLLLRLNRPVHLKGISRELKIDYASLYRHVEKLKSVGVVGVHDVGRSRVPYVKERDKVEQILGEASEICMSKTS
jgi:predicted transcriptional regulator